MLSPVKFDKKENPSKKLRPEKVFFLIFISTFFQNLVQFFIEESSFLRSSDICYIGFRDTEELDEPV